MRRVVTIDEQGAIEHCFHMAVRPVTVLVQTQIGEVERLDFHRCQDCERTWVHDDVRGGWNEVMA